MLSRICACRNVISKTNYLFQLKKGYQTFLNSKPNSLHQLKSKNKIVINNFNARQFSNGPDSTKYRKIVGGWLVICGGMVFVAVTLGGVTRLTKSGLSMVTWKLFGEHLPRNENEWIEEFELYKQFPEYQIMNKEMTINEFKWIWYMEYIHRCWGRALGAVFAIPAVGFWAKGWLDKTMKRNVILMALLIGAQGLMGWYMVKSGLEDRFHGESDVPRVSQYRLASHLSLAFLLYALFLHSAFNQLLPPVEIKSSAILKFKRLVWSCKGLVFLTAISGAFVAGIEAGLIYNSFPKMADKWIPDEILALSPAFVNFFENPVTTQFDHRLLGMSTFSLVSITWLLSRRYKLPRRASLAVQALMGLAIVQASLGISTLLFYVPTWLAASHQSGSMALFTSAIWLTHELKKIPK